MKIIKPAHSLLEKYAGKLQLRYSNAQGLNAALDQGLKEVSKIPGIDFYDIRHCVGTWARRKCGYSKDDVAEALNQTDRTVTDIYIAQDWSLIAYYGQTVPSVSVQTGQRFVDRIFSLASLSHSTAKGAGSISFSL